MNTWKMLASLRDRAFGQNISSVVKSQTIRQKTSLGRSLSTGAANSESDTNLTEKNTRLGAIDLSRKLREKKAKAEAEKRPPPGSRVQARVAELKRFSAQLQNVHPNVLAKQLFRSVLYQSKDVVIINKPYGVPIHVSPGVTSITSVLPVLAKMMDRMRVNSSFQLHPCLGPEKDATGPLVLATSQETVEQVLNLRRHNQIQQKYWVITVGVPVPSEGIIDIPLLEKQVPGSRTHFKMALSPYFKMNDDGDGLKKMRVSRQAHPATSKYTVLDSSSGCSLVELEPLTRQKHQLRVHLAYALTCPILGDHKYSHWTKLAPQNLSERLLKKLGLEKSKSRYVPLHLHKRQLTITGFNEEIIDVTCPLPKYFRQSLKRLLLTLPEGVDK